MPPYGAFALFFRSTEQWKTIKNAKKHAGYLPTVDTVIEQNTGNNRSTLVPQGMVGTVPSLNAVGR